MNIDGYILEEYAAGWVLKSPYIGKDKDGNKKRQYKETYHANIEQALFYIRDRLAKGCDTAVELISLLEQCREIDQQILSQNGLIRSQEAS